MGIAVNLQLLKGEMIRPIGEVIETGDRKYPGPSSVFFFVLPVDVLLIRKWCPVVVDDQRAVIVASVIYEDCAWSPLSLRLISLTRPGQPPFDR